MTISSKQGEGTTVRIVIPKSIEHPMRREVERVINLKVNTAKGLSTLKIQGGIAAMETALDFTLEDVTFMWGANFVEILDSGSFGNKKAGVFTYKRPRDGNGDITGFTIDLNKCTYKLDIKNTIQALDSTGTVNMEIFSDGFESGDTTSWSFN